MGKAVVLKRLRLFLLLFAIPIAVGCLLAAAERVEALGAACSRSVGSVAARVRSRLNRHRRDWG
jgi:hypothetical protein